MAPIRKPYPSDVSEEEWSLVAPYLTLMDESAPQRQHSLRELFNGLRYVLRYGVAWRAMPNDLPPWSAVYQQAQRWMAAGVFEALAQDLRAVLRLAAGRKEEPTAAIIDSRTLRSTPESGPRADYDGAKRKRGSKLLWRSTHWAICWPCMSRRQMSTTAPKSENSPRPCSSRQAKASS
jgi:transposase